MVVIRAYDNYIPAHMMLHRLEEEGITGYLQDEHSVTINPIFSNAIGGIKLLVIESQFSRALELVEAIEETYKNAGACVQCGSVNVQFISQPQNVYHCFDCGFEFEELP